MSIKKFEIEKNQIVYRKKEEKVEVLEEEKEDLLETMTLIKSGKFVDIRADTKAVFKISQKSISNTKIKRVLVCKTKGCSKKGEIILYGKSENYCELWLNKYPHEETCENQSDLFKHPNLRILLGTSLKPTEIIKKFNQGSERKLIDNDETRKKN